MPNSNAADVRALKDERSDAIALLRLWTEAFVAAGAPGDFAVNVEGESYDFSDWRAKKIAEIKALTELISTMAAPWIVRTRSR